MYQKPAHIRQTQNHDQPTRLSSFLLIRPYLLIITLTKRHKVHHYQSPGLLYGGGFQKCLVFEYVGTAKIKIASNIFQQQSQYFNNKVGPYSTFSYVTVATWTGFKCQLCTLDTGQWTGLSKATDMDTGQTQGGAF